jgi:hypothetical protein
MNSRNILIAISGFIVVAVLANYFLKNDKSILTATTEVPEKTPQGANLTNSAQTTNITSITPTGSQETTKAEQKTDYRYIKDRIEAMQQRRPNMKFEPAEVAAAIERDTAWKPLKDLPKELPLKPEEFTDGREFISLDSLKIETLMPGDKMRVPIKAIGREYEVIIDNIEKHDYNSISWNGHIEGGDGRNYNATFTRGESLTVGGMDTPDGQYELQAHGNNGWIASANVLFKNHVDPIDPNTVEPGAVPVQPKNNSKATTP